MPSRREFLCSVGAIGAIGVLGGASMLMAARHGKRHWQAPAWIDNTGTENVSSALTLWLARTGETGDVFRLRRRADGSPGRYWVPQGVRIGKPMIFDMNGCELVTGLTLGADDPEFEANRTTYPALWNDWSEQSEADDEYNNNGRAWPKRRVVVLIAASQVLLGSSEPGARIQGAARAVRYRSPEVIGRQMSTGCVYEPTVQGQHGIRIGGYPGPYSNAHSYSDIVLDLTDISVEFVHGDGVYLGDNHHNIRILGRNLGEPVLGGSTHVDDNAIQGYTGQGGEVVEGATFELDRWEPDVAPLPGIHHTSRHGVATDFRNYGTLIEDLAIWRTGQAVIDWEPAADDAEVVGAVIRGVEVGIHTLLFMPCAGPGPIRDLTCEDVVLYELPTIDTHQPAATHRHSNWLLRNIRCVSEVKKQSGHVFTLPRIDGLQVLDNHALIDGTADGIATSTGGTGTNGPSTDTVIEPAEDAQFRYSA